MKKPKKIQKAWFKKTRGSYLPISWQGALLYVPMIYFVVMAFIVIDKNSHSVSDTLINWFPYLVCTGVVMHWIASKRSI